MRCLLIFNIGYIYPELQLTGIIVQDKMDVNIQISKI